MIVPYLHTKEYIYTKFTLIGIYLVGRFP